MDTYTRSYDKYIWIQEEQTFNLVGEYIKLVIMINIEDLNGDVLHEYSNGKEYVGCTDTHIIILNHNENSAISIAFEDISSLSTSFNSSKLARIIPRKHGKIVIAQENKSDVVISVDGFFPDLSELEELANVIESQYKDAQAPNE